jgi:RimJ/RimL family protein N-acetyltransferase
VTVGAILGSMMGTLETERLVLRPFGLDDLDALVTLHAEPSFWHYPLGRGQTRAETEAFLDRTIARYSVAGLGLQAVIAADTGILLGWAGLSEPTWLPEILPAVEVGWRLGAAWWGRGLATEAGAASVRFGFETLDLDRVVSIFEPANTRSGRVMAKLGFELERITRHAESGMELSVTVLSRDWWAQRCDEGIWPDPSGPPGPPDPRATGADGDPAQ